MHFADLLYYSGLLLVAGQAAGVLAAGLGAVWAMQCNSLRRRATESYRQLNAALDHTAEGIARLDARGNYVNLNAVYSRSCGYEPGEMLGRHWTLTVHPEDRQKMAKAFDQMLYRGLTEIEALACRKDGTVFHTHVVMVALRDADGTLLGHHRFMKDITLRKMSEAALSDSERRFRVLAAHAPVGIFQSDCEGRCTYVNARWTDMTGIDAKQAAKTGWLDALHPDDVSQMTATWRGATVAGREWNADMRFRRPDGSVIRVSCSAAPVRDEAGAVRGYIGTLTNVTALKESEEALPATSRGIAPQQS